MKGISLAASIDELANSARLKLNRARQHIGELDRVVTEYLASKPMRLLVSYDAKIKHLTYHLEQNRPVPEIVGPIIGDIVHNLSSSLDSVMWSMVGHLADNPKNVQFPFAETEENLEMRIVKTAAVLAGTEVVGVIRSLKPYSTPKMDGLYSLHRLSNIDKHRAILALGGSSLNNATDFNSVVSLPFLSNRSDIGIGLEANAKFILTEVQDFQVGLRVGAIPTEALGQPPLSVDFAEGEWFEAQPVVPTLNILVEWVEGAIFDMLTTYTSTSAGH